MVAYRQNDRCNDHTYKMTDAIVTWTEWQMQLSHKQNDRCYGHTDRMTDAVVTRTVYMTACNHHMDSVTACNDNMDSISDAMIPRSEWQMRWWHIQKYLLWKKHFQWATVQYALFRLEVHRGRLLNTEQYTVHTVLSTYVCHNRLGNGMTRERKILKGFTNMHEII